MKYLISSLIVLISTSILKSQERPEIDLETFAERRFQLQGDDLDYGSIYESLLLFYTNPINLNKTNAEELSSLCILSPVQINDFFNHLKENGPLLSIYELQSIKSFDLITIKELLPFVSVNERVDSRTLFQRIREEDNNYLLIRQSGTLEQQQGYKKNQENGYLGSPGTTYMRYRIQRYRDFSLGFTMEKDDGEKLWDSKNKSPEFLSGHLALENKGIIEKALLGDFQLQFGQGLVYGAGFSPGKGYEAVNAVKRSSTGIRSYSSALESGFFRGIASTVSFQKVSVTTFYSHIKQDGTLINDTTYSDFDEYVNSIAITGYHRTPNELISKNQIAETSFGGALEYQPIHQLKIGFTGLRTSYTLPIQKKSNNYNQFEFKGTDNNIGSFYGVYNWQNIILFGEAARSSSGGIGAVAGWMASLSYHLDMSMVLRNYDRNFHSLYGSGFSENSRLINEKGIYWGLKVHPNRRHTVDLYYDHFSFPWLKYQVESPSQGYEYLVRYTFNPIKKVSMYTQFREESKQKTVSENQSNLSVLKTGLKRNYLFNVDYGLGPLSLKTRVQASEYTINNEVTHGFVLVQDLNYEFRKLRLSSRFTLFDTDNFNNAQYVYERDVLYAFSIPALNGTGIRSYLMAQYTFFKAFTLWCRVARTTYKDQQTIGSGFSTINGNTRTDYRLMIRIKF